MDNWNEYAPLPDDDAELKRIRKNLNKRSWKTILTSLLLAAAILLAAVFGVIPAVESLYWAPYTSDYAEGANDLQMVLQTYTELFQPGYTASVNAGRTGFATYELSIVRTDVTTWEREYIDGTLERGKLYFGREFSDERLSQMHFYRARDHRPINEYDRERTRQLLAELPEYIQLKAAISFPEDLTMEELINLSMYYNRGLLNSHDGISFKWAGIRNCHEEPERSTLLCGMALSYSTDDLSLNEVYPELVTESYSPDGSHFEQHFKSLLQFASDQLKKDRMIPVWINDDYYQYVLDYVEENGVMTYGCLVTATPQQLLTLLEDGAVSDIVLMDCWIDIG